MNTLFISDLHLSEERPLVTAAFFAFLQQQTGQCDALYILGDFFDAWIGDDDDRPLAEQVARALKKLADSGTRIFFQHGNRDFLLGEPYATRCGMQLLPELHVIELAGRRCLLAHGDQFCTGDTAYQQFRSMVRQTQWQQDFLGKPLAERREIAAALRARSRDANSMKAEDIMDVTQSEIIATLQQQHCELLIHGHTHRPACHRITLPDHNEAQRIVLGEWLADSYWLIRDDCENAAQLQHLTT